MRPMTLLPAAASECACTSMTACTVLPAVAAASSDCAVGVADGDRRDGPERRPAVEAHAADLDQVAVGERIVEHGDGAGGGDVGVLRGAVIAAIAIEERDFAVQVDGRDLDGMRGADVDDVGVGVAGAGAFEDLERGRHGRAVDGGG